jgi:hypothetical protein
MTLAYELVLTYDILWWRLQSPEWNAGHAEDDGSDAAAVRKAKLDATFSILRGSITAQGARGAGGGGAGAAVGIVEEGDRVVFSRTMTPNGPRMDVHKQSA